MQSTEIKSKHGVILSCSFSYDGVNRTSVNEELFKLAKALEGKRYGFVDKAAVEKQTARIHSRDVWKWLKRVMEC
jgi:lipoate---protein ligase